MQYITTQGIRFDVITTNDEIIFIDERGDSLTWDNTLENQVLVDNMVYELENRVL